MVSLKWSTICLLLFILAFTSASAVFAQTGTSEVNGTVTDPTGGVLPGINVKLINQGTQLVDQRPTNGTGYFVFVNVKPGTYIIRVEAPGYKTTTTSPFEVQVNETVSQSVKLVVGQVTETVEVQDTAALIEKTTTELGTVIDEKTVEELPLNGRNFTQLLTLTPGVTPVSTAQNRSVGCCEGNVGIPGSAFSDASFHGQQNRSKLYFYDGIINTNVRGPTYIVIPNVDLIQEFKIVGHDAKAEYGGAAGGVVNVVSKPGTDRFHASAFEFLRNDYFDARDSFADGKCSPGRCKPGQIVPKAAAPYRQNQFGVVITGPIIKHRTFFAFGYDAWRYSKADGNLSYVPTAAELSGDFTLHTATNGVINPAFYGNRQLYNPYSTRQFGANFLRDPFFCANGGNGSPLALLPGQNVQVTPNPSGQTTAPAGAAACNRIPQALISPVILQFFQTYAPRPNLFDPTNPNVNFIRTRPTRNESNAYSIRIDHRFRDSDNIFFRYTEQRNHVFNPIGDVGDSQGGSQGRNYGADWVHAFSANVILDVRGGVADRPGVDAGQQNEHPKGVAGLNQLGFLSTDKYHGILIQTGGSNVWSPGGSNDFGIRGAADRKNPDWSITPSLTWLKGNHNIKTGFMYIDTRRIQLNTYQRYLFDTGTTNLPGNPNNTGLQLASALLGFPTSFKSELPQPHGGEVKFKFAGWGVFLQDEWRVRPTVTLTAGLRYDYVTRVHTLDGRLWSAIDLKRQQYIVGSGPLQACSVVGHAPCIPNAPVPGFPNGFFSDPHFGNLVYANRSDFSPPPIKDNWGPRIGVAWSITPKTVLRAGYGLYWDSMTARSQWAQNELEALTWPDATSFTGDTNTCVPNSNCAFTVPANPNDPNASHQIIEQQKLGFGTPLPLYLGPTGGAPWTTGGFQNDPNYKDGYAQEWNLELQRELSAKMMVSAAYVGSHSGRLVYTGNANAASAPANCLALTGAAQTTCRQNQDLLRPMPWLTPSSNYARSIGYADYHALEARFQHRLSNGLSTLVSYTWSKSTDVTSGYFGSAENGNGGGTGTIQNFYDQRTAHGVSSYDITHFLSWSALYELPFGKGKQWLQSGPASWIFGNWQTNYIFQARSGQPYNLGVNGDLASLAGTFTSNSPTNYLRPNLLPGVDPFAAGPVASNPDPGCATTISQGGKAADQTHTVTNWFNPCAFTTPPIGTFGTFGRNALRGPHVVNMDFGLTKSIPLAREGMSIQFRAEAFNVFNIQNWDGPSTNSATAINSGNNATTINRTAGQVTQLAQGTSARELQFGIKVIF